MIRGINVGKKYIPFFLLLPINRILPEIKKARSLVFHYRFKYLWALSYELQRKSTLFPNTDTMKNIYTLILFCVVVAVIPAPAQKFSRPVARGNYDRIEAFKPSALDEATSLLRDDKHVLVWMDDSTYYSSWNTGLSDWDLYEKNFKAYDANLQILESKYTVYDNILLSWHNSFRYVNSYYSGGGWEIMGTQTWDTSPGLWKDVSHNHYNTSGKIDTSFSKVYDATFHRYNSGTQRIYTYDGSGLNTQSLEQSLDTAVLSWVNHFLNTNLFDSGNHITQTIQQVWSTGLSAWVNNTKTDYVYDASGYETGETDYTWNNGTSSWDNFMRRTIVNNASGSPLTITTEVWDFGTTSWKNSGRETWQYNGNNKVTQYLAEDWNGTLLSWMNYSKETYTYYSNGYNDETTTYLWNHLLSVFMDNSYAKSDSLGYTLEYYTKFIDGLTYDYYGGYKYIYSYTPTHYTDVILEQQLNPFSLAWYDFSHRLDTYDSDQNLILELDQNYDTLTSVWTNTYKQDHYFSSTSGIHEKGRTSDYCFYANPISAGQSITCPNLSAGKNYLINLCDMQGRVVYGRDIYAGESFTVPENLPKGMYLMQILSDGNLQASGKVIIR